MTHQQPQRLDNCYEMKAKWSFPKNVREEDEKGSVISNHNVNKCVEEESPTSEVGEIIK